MNQILFLVKIAVTLATLLTPATAAEKNHVLSFKPGESTSDCIGNPITPECAADTVHSCTALAVWEHCEIVGFDHSIYEGRVPSNYMRLWIWKYRNLDQRVLTAASIPAWARSQGAKSWRPGDVALRVYWEQCMPQDECVERTQSLPREDYGKGCPRTSCTSTDHPLTLVVRRRGDKWVYVDERGYTGPHIEFWNRK